MNFLLSNDDGVDAPGLAALRNAVAGLGQPTIVAPVSEHSGCSHGTTTSRSLRFERRTDDVYAVDGTPADCIRVALHEFPQSFDWVLAGINAGGNLGIDVYYSGTVSAAREAAFYGLPAIAVSHYKKSGIDFAWDRAAQWVRPVIEGLIAQHSVRNDREHYVWNINVPHLDAAASDPEIVVCPLELAPLPLEYRDDDGRLRYSGAYHQRPRGVGSDVDVCFSGKIAVTRISFAG